MYKTIITLQGKRVFRHGFIFLRLAIFLLLNFLIYLYVFNQDLSIISCLSIPTSSDYKFRDNKGRFRTPNSEEVKPLIPPSK
jgi:hypothetical protein